MSERILLVDDEANVLAGYRRQLRKEFTIVTAEGGPAGLELMGNGDTFAVVVSDMRMPEMDGIAFLREVKHRSPESVRVMLTGNADLQTCVDAVNEGCIFRFLTKPCPPEILASTLNACLDQYRLVVAERELIQGTLQGCIRTLGDVLSVMSPGAFSRASRIRRCVRHMAAQLNARHFWEYEMAAALSQIGCVAMPPEILARINAGRPLTVEQRGILANHPEYGCQLLAEIPRLELVAQIVARQSKPSRRRILPGDIETEEDVIDFGAQILRVALDLDGHLQRGLSFIEALSELHREYGPDNPHVESLMSFQKGQADRVTMEVTAKDLSTGMVAAENIVGSSGHVIVAKGQPITDPMRFHLQSCAHSGGLKEPFLVEVITEER